jgi:hypothetical protein
MRPGNIYSIFVMLSAPRLIACLPYLSESNKNELKHLWPANSRLFLHFFRNTSIKKSNSLPSDKMQVSLPCVPSCHL